MEQTQVEFNQWGQGLLEAGGVDVGTATGTLTNGNFGIGQMAITGGGGKAVVIQDEFENLDGGPDALYLFGLSGQDGLRIDGHSVLVLNGINTYSSTGGVVTHLNGMPGCRAYAAYNCNAPESESATLDSGGETCSYPRLSLKFWSAS